MYSAVKQRLMCNTDKVFNCLNQFLLTMFLSIEEHVFLFEYVFQEGNSYTDLVQEQFAEKFQETPPDFYLWGAAKSAVYHDHSCTLNELKTAITVYIRNISPADLQKVFANKIKQVQACMDAHGHHFQHLL
jgi:hypothetical protein